MGNYCNGTATCVGPRETLDKVFVLAERLDDCASASGFDADPDWLGHIFREEYSSLGVFYEGGWFDGDDLNLEIRVSRSNGCDFFQGMASSLGITIKWVYVDDYDGREHKKTLKPKKLDTPWELRAEEELDDDGSVGNIPASVVDVQQAREASPQPRPCFSAQSFSSGSYAYGSPSGVGRMNLLQMGGSPGGREQDRKTQQVATMQDDIYFHCLAASTLTNRLHGEVTVQQRSRICADIYIAAEELLEVANAIFTTAQQIEASSDLSQLTDIRMALRAAFVVDASALKYSAVVGEDVRYETVYRAHQLICSLAMLAMPQHAVALMGLPLPLALW